MFACFSSFKSLVIIRLRVEVINTKRLEVKSVRVAFELERNFRHHSWSSDQQKQTHQLGAP